MLLGSFPLWLCLGVLVPIPAAHAFVGPPPSSIVLSTHQQTRSFARTSSLNHHSHRRGVRNREQILRAEAGNVQAQEAGEPAAVLKAAIESRKVPMTEVVEALTELAKDSASSATFGAEDVEGSWELVFSTQLKSGYMPIRELVGFYPSREEATIDTNAGPLPIGGMRGRCWWKGGPENELAFALEEVKLGPFKVAKGKNEVKSYKFFVNDGKILAAKSSAGGYTLLSRVAQRRVGTSKDWYNLWESETGRSRALPCRPMSPEGGRKA